MGVNFVFAAICGVLVLFGDRITAEVLFSDAGPITPAEGKNIGTTAVPDQMHLEFDVTVNSVPEKIEGDDGWREVFSVAGGKWSPSLHFHETSDDEGGQFEGWALTFQDDYDWSLGVAVVAGECYHFELDWTQSYIFVKINGVIVWDKPDAATHDTWESQDIFMCWGPNSFPPADVTVSNFIISDDISCWVAGFECPNGEVCGAGGACCDAGGSCTGTDAGKCAEDASEPASKPTLKPTSKPTLKPTLEPMSKYIPVHEGMLWYDARKYCIDEYGTSLATIRNDKDGEEFMALSGHGPYWTGLNDLRKEGTWEWVDGLGLDDYYCDEWCNSYRKAGHNYKWWRGGDHPTHDCAFVRLGDGFTTIDKQLEGGPCHEYRLRFVCNAPVWEYRMQSVETDVNAVEKAVTSVRDELWSVDNVLSGLVAESQNEAPSTPIEEGTSELIERIKASADENKESIAGIKTSVVDIQAAVDNIQTAWINLEKGWAAAHAPPSGNVDTVGMLGEDSVSTLSVRGKDLLMAGLAAVNLLLLTAMAISCFRQSPGRKVYEAVNICTESEHEKF